MRASEPREALRVSIGARRSGRTTLAAVLALLLTLVAPASAQDTKKDAREREAMRRLQAAQGELARVAKERDQLIAERAEAAGRMKQAEQALSSTRAAAATERRRQSEELSGLRTELDTWRKSSEAATREAVELGDQIRALARQLEVARTHGSELDAAVRARTQEGSRAAQELMASRRAFAQCEAQSDRLHAFGLELLDQLGRVTVLEAMRRNEPLLALRRVDLENMMEAYRDRLQAARAGLPER